MQQRDDRAGHEAPSAVQDQPALGIRYISDSQLGSATQGATNKSEAPNRFLKWTFFGDEASSRNTTDSEVARDSEATIQTGFSTDVDMADLHLRPENIIRPYYTSFFSPRKSQWTLYLSARCP
jgi:hypothetical protein